MKYYFFKFKKNGVTAVTNIDFFNFVHIND